MTTLISFLGKGQDGRGYRPANYRFEDGMLGTRGSMWDVF